MTPSVTIVIPCFNEETALPRCIDRVARYVAAQPLGSVEVVLVDDGSTDGTWSVLERLLEGRAGWRAIRLITNRGSHVALRCACRYATGARVVNLPVDLQDPIENIDRLLETMNEQGVDAVLAVRRTRNDGWWSELTSRLYNGAMHLVNLRKVPLEGTSQFLLTRRVVYQINAHGDHGFTFEGFLASAPLRLAIVWYDREAAVGRVSRWTFGRKVQHALNTILSFSNVPIRALSMTGASVACAGLVYAALVLVRFSFFGGSVAGWPSLMTAVLVIGGFNLLALGLVGEYVWRILDESRRRPLYQIEDALGLEPDARVGAATDGSRAHE
ncbi:MAG: glycosyltransferase [Acidobacteria bacterium]|nr:glycosyltransferase [Acidobacteriota bacterium]